MLKNVASQVVGAQMITAADGTAFTGSVTVLVTGDGGTQATGSVGAGACTHEGNGFHTYVPAQAETNYNHVAFTFTGTGAIPATVQVYTRPTTGLLAPATAGRTIVVDASGLADANVVKVGPTGSGTAQTARDLGASVLISSGTGTGQLSVTSGVIAANTTQWGGTAVASANVRANLTQILGTAPTEGGAGRLAGAFTKLYDVASPVLTTASVNQTGDSYARIGSNGAGLTALATAANLSSFQTTLTTITKGLVLTGGEVIGDTGNDTTHIHFPAWTYANDAINNQLLVIYDDSANEYHVRWVEDWVLSTGLITVATLPFTPEDLTDLIWLTSIRRDVTGGSGLDAAGVRAAVGLASANLDTQLGDLPTNSELATALAAADDAVLAAVATAQADLDILTGTDGATVSTASMKALIETCFTYDATATYGTADAGSLVAQIADNAGGSALTTDAIAEAMFTYNATADYSTADAGSVVKQIADNAGGSALTADAIADEVETRTIAAVTTVTTTTNLTNLPTIPANWLTAAGTAADFTTEIQSGLATASALGTLASTVNAIYVDTNTTLPAAIAGVPTNAELATALADQSGFTSIVHVAHTGDDTASGAAWVAAVEGASAGTLVITGPGYFSVTYPIVIADGIVVRGAGRGATTIHVNDRETVNDTYAIQPGTNSSIENMTIYQEVDGFVIGVFGSAQVTNSYIRNVDIRCDFLETIVVSSSAACELTFENVYTTCVGEWGLTAVGAAHNIRLKNFTVFITQNQSPTDPKGLRVESGSQLIGDNVQLMVNESANAGYPIMLTGASGVYLSNSSMFAGPIEIEDDTGFVYLVNCTRDRTQVGSNNDRIVDVVGVPTEEYLDDALAALNDLSSAEAQSAAAAALTAYDPPTNAEMEARTLTAASYATATVADAIKAVTDLLTAAQAELAAVPAANATPLQKLAWLAMIARNKITETATTQIVMADDGTTTVGTATVSDDGTTFARGEFS